MASLRLTFFFCTLSVILALTSGLKCYNCTDCANSPSNSQECHDKEAKECFTVSFFNITTKKAEVDRLCVSKNHTCGIYKNNINITFNECLTCTTDNCNPASELSMSAVLLIATSAAVWMSFLRK